MDSYLNNQIIFSYIQMIIQIMISPNLKAKKFCLKLSMMIKEREKIKKKQ